MKRQRSIGLYQKALGMIPGGVNSPVRAFKAIGIPPAFVDRGKGAKVWDVDGNETGMSRLSVNAQINDGNGITVTLSPCFVYLHYAFKFPSIFSYLSP